MPGPASRRAGRRVDREAAEDFELLPVDRLEEEDGIEEPLETGSSQGSMTSRRVQS